VNIEECRKYAVKEKKKLMYFRIFQARFNIGSPRNSLTILSWAVGGMDGFGDKPLIVFITIYCFFVLTLNFTFSIGISQRLPLCI
jgi:hypothetical protein